MALALVACGDTTPTSGAGATIGEEALPGRLADLRSISLATLDERELADEALDPGQLADLLRATGLEGAVERSYSAPGPTIRRVEVRVVRFATEGGAERYLAWQLEHLTDLVGDLEVSAETLDGATLFVHVPDACCAKEQAVAVAAWRAGVDIVRIFVAGPGADDAAGTTLIERLHGSLVAEI